jgi:hypothetical protein
MTTPKLIDGGKSPPCPHHPAVKSETTDERRRCLALVDEERKKQKGLVRVALLQIRERIESGEQP